MQGQLGGEVGMKGWRYLEWGGEGQRTMNLSGERWIKGETDRFSRAEVGGEGDTEENVRQEECRVGWL